MERKSFLIVSKETLADKRISATAKLLLALLRDYWNKETGQCNPKRDKLAENLGVSESIVKRALSELRNAGFLTSKKGQRGNTYDLCTENPAGSKSPGRENPAGSKSPGAPVQNRPAEAPVSLYEPDLLNQKGCAAAAKLVTAAAAAAPTPGVSGSSPDPDTPAQKLVLELMPQHPEPGNSQKAVSEAGKLLAARPGAETVEAIRRNHALWRVHWASYAPGRFIPQLWRWFHDGDWEFPPVERKGALPRETWAEMRQREKKEYDEQFYRDLAEEGAWDVLRQYGGESAVEVWRERIKNEVA